MDRLFWIVLRRLRSRLDRGVAHCEAGDRGRVASHRIPAVLALAVSWTRRWQGQGLSRNPGADPANAQENPTWGAPKIHGELLKLGLLLSERSVSRYLRAIQRRGDPGKRWLAFLQNHREAIVALDFFTVPTVSFLVLYCLFVIEHARRKILHFRVTPHPNSDWVVQQLREAFPETTPYRYAILDRDSEFDSEVLGALRSMGLKPKRTSRKAPWQNGVAERWVGSCRRELLDHVIPLDEQHLQRLIADFIRYYHADRIHDSLGKDTPDRRAVENRPSSEANVISFPRLGGLHHRYGWQQAA
jgi:putative transposase